MSHPAVILVGMALNLPQRFINRPVAEFAAGLDVVHADYWHWHSKGDMRFGRPAGLMAEGSRAAMLWVSGQSPFPPAYGEPLQRTRGNLLKLLRYSEMVLAGEGEQVDREDGAVNITANYTHAGAREIYHWVLGMTDELPGDTLLPEERRAARMYMLDQQATERHVA